MYLKNKKILIILSVIVVLIVSLFIINNLYKEEPVIKTEYISYVEPEKTENVNMFYVDLKGAVKKPGVYKIKEGTIINELISLAGGLKKNAYTDNINLSKKLEPQEVIYINTVNEMKHSTTTTSIPIVNKNEDINNISLVNINTASINELTSLNGIGEAKALAIVAYRTQSPFKSIDEIMNVEGIGESAFAKIKDNITI